MKLSFPSDSCPIKLVTFLDFTMPTVEFLNTFLPVLVVFFY